jgi:transposase
MKQKPSLLLELVVRLDRGEVDKIFVSKALGGEPVSIRTVERYLAAYRKLGPRFVNHGNASRAPYNKVNPETRTTIIELMQTKYFDCNCVHASELLAKNEALIVNPETLRLWLKKLEFVKKAKRRKKPKRYRERMSQTGIMLQFDGSHHHWFANQESVLIAGIDDADNDVACGFFSKAEDTLSCMVVLRKIVELRGLFGFLYTDQAGLFGGSKRIQFSQVKRALKELGISVVTTSSPEAKGRIERLWGTLQDRLVPEFRLAKVTTQAQANAYFNEVFLPQTYGSKFRLKSSSEKPINNGYRPLPVDVDLDEIFCIKEYRTVKRDHTLSLDGVIYKITSELARSIENQKVEIRIYPGGQRRVFFGRHEIQVEAVGSTKLFDDKELDMLKLHKLESLKVRWDGHVKHGRHYYSLGPELANKHVHVLLDKDKVKFYYQGQLHVEHDVVESSSTKIITLPAHKGAMTIALDSNSMFIQASRRIGPWAEKVIRTVIERGDGFLDLKLIWGIIKSTPEYSRIELDRACKMAYEINEVNYKTIRTILRIHSLTNTRLSTKNG